MTLNRITSLLNGADIPKKRHRYKLAEVCGINYSAVAQWFNGETKEIDAKNLKAIADEFNVSVDYLMGTADKEIKEGSHLYALADKAIALGMEKQIEGLVQNFLDAVESKK